MCVRSYASLFVCLFHSLRIKSLRHRLWLTLRSYQEEEQHEEYQEEAHVCPLNNIALRLTLHRRSK
jgi:hypothetical protein